MDYESFPQLIIWCLFVCFPSYWHQQWSFLIIIFPSETVHVYTVDLWDSCHCFKGLLFQREGPLVTGRQIYASHYLAWVFWVVGLASWWDLLASQWETGIMFQSLGLGKIKTFSFTSRIFKILFSCDKFLCFICPDVGRTAFQAYWHLLHPHPLTPTPTILSEFQILSIKVLESRAQGLT